MNRNDLFCGYYFGYCSTKCKPSSKGGNRSVGEQSPEEKRQTPEALSPVGGKDQGQASGALVPAIVTEMATHVV
jgi:hypothetical protein